MSTNEQPNAGIPASREDAEAELKQVTDWINEAMQQIPAARERAAFLNGYIYASQTAEKE
jgi:hypothetical protein